MKRYEVLLLVLTGILAYGNTIQNGLFWDDDEFITHNTYIRSFQFIPQWFTTPITAGAGVNSNYYRPLLTASFSLDYHLWGLWAPGYHIENMLWHIAAAVLLYLFLKYLLSTIYQLPSLLAFATSLLWLVHPAHVEAVAYANSRGDSMATVFILLSLLFWLKGKTKGSAIAFVMALLSKEFAIVTPGLIVLVELQKARPFSKRPGLLKLSSHSVILATYLLLRLTVLNFQNTLNFYGTELSHIDRTQPLALYATSLPVRLMTFLNVLPIYGKILIWPTDLHMERTVDIATSVTDPTVVTVLAVVAVIGILFIWAVFKGPALLHKAGPYQILIFAVAWFFISIFPTSGIIPISQILAEHFLYLPSIGFFLIIAWLLASIIRQRILFFIVLCLLFAVLSFKTISQNRIWHDPITFYEYTLAHAQPTARVYNNLAMAYAEEKKSDKAIENYYSAIALSDVYPNPHYNLANTLKDQGKIEEAELEYKRALKKDPKFYYATLKLGQLYLDEGKTAEAKSLVCPIFPDQSLCRSAGK